MPPRVVVPLAGFLLATGASACAASWQVHGDTSSFDLPPVPEPGGVSPTK